MTASIQDVDWQKMLGLAPAIIQHYLTGELLMLGYMNEQALRTTIETKLVTFYSRSRQTLWQKGESSGHTLELKTWTLDCDQDAILVRAHPNGPTCHKGTTSCFGEGAGNQLSILQKVIARRAAEMSDRSYTAELIASGVDKIAQKVGEEAVEVVIAAKNNNQDEFIKETADLLYHVSVLIQAKSVALEQVFAELAQRAK